MVDLALHFGKGVVPLKDIALRQEISEKYLWNLILPLKIAGLIRSERGARGGFVVARPPSEVTMKDVVCALESSLYITECIDQTHTCNRSQICVTRDLWKEISDAIMEKLESTTLEDMVNRQQTKWELATAGVSQSSI